MAYCINCGKELNENAKFCDECGAKVANVNEIQAKNIDKTLLTNDDCNKKIVTEENAKETVTYEESISEKTTTVEYKSTGRMRAFWDKMTLFSKIATVGIILFVILGSVTFGIGEIFSGVISAISVIFIILAILIKKEVIKAKHKCLSVIFVVVAFLLLIPFVKTLEISNTCDKKADQNNSIVENTEKEKSEKDESEEMQSPKSKDKSDNIKKITVSISEGDLKGMKKSEAEEKLKEMGFKTFEYEKTKTEKKSQSGKISAVEIKNKNDDDGDFSKGDKFEQNAIVTLWTYEYKEPAKPKATQTPKPTKAPEKPKAEYYSTNDYETAKKGNTGVFSYKDDGKNYDIYYIIDFDKGYVYYFTDGNGENFCDKLEIESGDLNDKIIITYHDGGTQWSYSLHFKYVNSPYTLVVRDHNGFDWEYSTTDLGDALLIKDTKTIKEY